MISIELWRARIGAFNNKRSRSRCSLSSTYFPIYVFFHWTRHRCRNVSRKELSEFQAHISPLTSPPSSSLSAEERSPAIETVVPKSSGDHIGELLSSSSSSSSSSLFLSSSFDVPCFLHRSLLRDAFIMLVIAIISQLLIMAGDVETNPGPKHRADEKPCLSDLQYMTCTNEEGRDFRLIDRVKTYWWNLAVALKFPSNEIASMEHKDDNSRVHYIFHEWLRGANHDKDSKPVTWATLITALKNANIQQEAKILEEHFVEMPHSVSSHKRRHDDQQTADDDEPPTKKPSLDHVKDGTAGSMGSSLDTQTRRVADFSPPLEHAVLGVPTEPTSASASRSSTRFFYHVSAQYRRDFIDLQEKFGDMFDELRENVRSSVPVDDLKQYLCSRFRELETDVEDADTTSDVMKVVHNECTLAEYSYFEKIANRFDLQEAKESIKHYRRTLDDFCKHTLEEHSHAKSFRVDHPEPIVPSSTKIEVTFMLEWNAKEKSLKDVRDVLRMAFGDLTDRVKIMVIKDGSIVVECWAPQYLMMELVRLAKNKLDQLQEIGVVKLTVGHIELITKKVDTFGGTTALESMSVTRQSSLTPPPSKSSKLSEDQSLLLSTKSFSSSSHSSTAVTRQSSLSPPPSKSEKLSEGQHFLLSTKSSSSRTAVTKKQYRKFLKDCYRQPLPYDDKLLTTASKHYIDLAVISREGVTRKEADEFTKKNLYGLTEEILRKKSPIALKDILKPREDGKPVRCVLIEGAPGIGKSTLAWEVCHKWEELDSVKHYELVVLVQLREKKAQEARCIEDLLPCGATTNMKELVAALCKGKGVLIVCDGFDELSDEKRKKGSVYIDLIKGRLLPEATIIVTSRPSVSDSLWRLCQHNIDRHLEVIGFTKEDIKRFAESVFSGDILEGFLSYITSNPPIYSMMYIPLNAVIVALIYQDSYDTDTPFPTTMTQLFDALTRALIRRHLVATRQILHSFHMPPSLQRWEDIEMLPPLVFKQFLELARVAYEGIYHERFVFTELDEDFEGLGMMKKITSVNVCTGPECSYTFLHLALQEYMAALYIATLQPGDFDLDNIVSKNVVIIRFLAGICRHSEYKNGIPYQKLTKLLSCNSLSLQLVHCVFECPSILDSVKMDVHCREDALAVRPVEGFDWYVTGYCISHFDLRWGLIIEDITESKITFLLKGLGVYPIGKIQNLVLIKLSLSQIHSLLGFFGNLFHLALVDVEFISDDAVILRQLITPGSGLSSFEWVGDILVENAVTLFSLLFDSSSLEELKIECKTLEFFDINTTLPHNNTNLKKLNISGHLLLRLSNFLPNITTLTYLKINSSTVDSVLISMMQSHPTLEVLELTFSSDEPMIEDVTELVEAARLSQIRELRIPKVVYDRLPLRDRELNRQLLRFIASDHDQQPLLDDGKLLTSAITTEYIERQRIAVHVVAERKFEVAAGEKLLWEEHGFSILIPEDGLIPYKTCIVTVKAIIPGLFQYPEGTEPVSAIYDISLSRPLIKPATLQLEHCVVLDNPEYIKFLSFAVASEEHSSMQYKFHEVPGGIFERNSSFGSIDRKHFCRLSILWNWLGSLKALLIRDVIQYCALSFTRTLSDKYEWVLAVSKNLKTMKQYLARSLEEATEQEEMVFMFKENGYLTIDIAEESTPGWIIELHRDPCPISKREVDSRDPDLGPVQRTVKIMELKCNPPTTELRNSINLDGIKPPCHFNISFNPRLDRDSNISYTVEEILSSPPTQNNFCAMVIKEIPAEWEIFGGLVEIPSGTLEGISHDKRGQAEECFLAVYSTWRNGQTREFTWRTVLNVLEDMRQIRLKEDIKKKLGIR